MLLKKLDGLDGSDIHVICVGQQYMEALQDRGFSVIDEEMSRLHVGFRLYNRRKRV